MNHALSFSFFFLFFLVYLHHLHFSFHPSPRCSLCSLCPSLLYISCFRALNEILLSANYPLQICDSLLLSLFLLCVYKPTQKNHDNAVNCILIEWLTSFFHKNYRTLQLHLVKYLLKNCSGIFYLTFFSKIPAVGELLLSAPEA